MSVTPYLLVLNTLGLGFLCFCAAWGHLAAAAIALGAWTLCNAMAAAEAWMNHT